MKSKIFNLTISTLLIVSLHSCSTTISSYNENSDKGKGGIPYYLPKLMVKVKNLIRAEQNESLHILFQVDNFKYFLVKVEEDNTWIKDLDLTLNSNIPEVNGSNTFISRTEIEYNGGNKKKEIIETKEFSNNTPVSEKPNNSLDVSDSIEIFTVPDTTKIFFLKIEPSYFAKHTITINLKDGWRLESLISDTGENQLISSTKDIITSALTQKTEQKKAETDLSKSKLADLANTIIEAIKKQPSSAITSFSKDNIHNKKITSIKTVGYFKKIETKSIKPGIYEYSTFSNDKNYITSTQWLKL